jgi:hypothetical protein
MAKASGANVPLDYIGIEEATDKNSLIGNYLNHYENLFKSIQDEPFNLVEIGVLDGASLRTWERFFSRATLVGVDIDPKCLAYAHDRVKIVIGSQDDLELLHRVVTDYAPFVFIDDGSHRSDHIIFTFERMFPLLRPGGYYIVEDMHFHEREEDRDRLKGISPIYATDYFLELARLHVAGPHSQRLPDGVKKYLIRSIDKISFISQATIIHKKPAESDFAARLPKLKLYTERSSNWLMWFSLAMRMRDNGVSDSEVIEALRASMALNANFVITYERLSEALERIGDGRGAMDALEKAITLSLNRPDFANGLRERLERLESRLAT